MELYTAILANFNPLSPIVPVPLFTFFIGRCPVVVSNHMLMVTVAAVLLAIGIPLSVRRTRLVPSGLQNLIESICVFLREEVARPVLGNETDRHIEFVWTIFFFVLSLNLLAMIPTEAIIFVITGKKNHFGGPATANIWITGALAMVAFFVTHIAGIKEQGFWHYIVNFAPKVPWPMLPFIYFLEIISALVKPFALAIRLFANMLAGHVLLGTLLGLIFVFKNYGVAFASVAASVAMSFMELFVAFLQAYIFTFLSALFVSFSIAPEH